MTSNLQMKINEALKLSLEELFELSTELSKNKSFFNRRLIQEVSKTIMCPHDRETLKQNFGFHERLEMINDEYLENLKPL